MLKLNLCDPDTASSLSDDLRNWNPLSAFYDKLLKL